jgi:hypothetical protein
LSIASLAVSNDVMNAATGSDSFIAIRHPGNGAPEWILVIPPVAGFSKKEDISLHNVSSFHLQILNHLWLKFSYHLQ